MNSIQEVSRLNNEGALLLSYGDQRTPLKYFKAGLQRLKEVCSCCSIPQEESPANKVSRSKQQVSIRKALPVPLLNDPKRYYAQMVQGTAYNGELPQEYIFRHAFMFQAEGDEMTLEKQSLASAVLMFNYGLGLHTRGEEHFDRALFLYSQSLQLLSHVSDCAVDCAELVAAILKNQADIYYRLNDFQNVRVVLDELFLQTCNMAVRDDMFKQSLPEDTIAPSA